VAPAERAPPLRIAIFVALVVWIVVTPALVQVFHLPVKWVRSWTMYSGAGRGVCDVQYYDQQSGEPLDYLQAFYDVEHFWQVEPYRRRVMRERLRGVGGDLCRTLKLRDVRAEAECAIRDTWKQEMDREENLCRRGRRTGGKP
jgi:hypothetical protein